MFRYQLTPLLFIVGCGLTSPPPSLTTTIESIPDTIIVTSPSLILENVEATLEMADEAMNKREANKANTERKMFSLKQLVNQEEELISELEDKLSIKDSIIRNKTEKLEVLTFQLGLTENKLSSTEEIIQRYIVAYNVLLEENNLLQTELDKTYSHVEYLDSLIFTNKKLIKVYESN